MSSGALQYEIFTIAQGMLRMYVETISAYMGWQNTGYLVYLFIKIIKVVEIVALHKTEMSQKHIQEDKKDGSN